MNFTVLALWLGIMIAYSEVIKKILALRSNAI
jgi:hypothetical protein